MKQHIFFLTFFVQFATFLAQTACHVKGECLLGGFIDNTATADYNECLDICKTTPTCTDFTYYESNALCATFTDCPLLSEATCENCFSGQSTCSYFLSDRQCGLQGKCDGAFLHIEEGRVSENDCIAMCHELNFCSYYTYTKSIKSCVALATCDSLLFTNDPDYVSGRSTCGNQDPATSYFALMVVGGSGDAGNDVEVIDLNRIGQTCFKPSDHPIEYGSTGIFFDGKPTVCGGYNNSYVSDCYRYNFQNDSWLSGLEMPNERSFGASSFLTFDEWWVSGGAGGAGSETTSNVLYFGNGTFQDYVDLPKTLYHHTMVRINDSLVAFVGDNDVTFEVYIFDKRTQNFTELPSLNTPRAYPQAGLIEQSNGTINLVVVSGFDGSGYTRTTEIYDFDDMSWSYGPDLPEAWGRGASVQFKNTFLVIGGYGSDGNVSNFIYEFDTDSMQWITRNETMQIARYNFAAFLISDEVARCTV